MDVHGGKRHARKDLHILLDQEVIEELNKAGVVRSRFINSLLRWALFGEEPSKIVKLLVKKQVEDFWCPGRDLNPGRGLERPACLTGLHHRGSSVSHNIDDDLKTFRLYASD